MVGFYRHVDRARDDMSALTFYTMTFAEAGSLTGLSRYCSVTVSQQLQLSGITCVHYLSYLSIASILVGCDCSAQYEGTVMFVGGSLH